MTKSSSGGVLKACGGTKPYQVEAGLYFNLSLFFTLCRECKGGCRSSLGGCCDPFGGPEESSFW